VEVEMEMKCVFCGEKIELSGPVGKSDECPRCRRDLRCCKQCEFYDAGAYNECREVSAERVLDKERSNSCDYFTPRGGEVSADGRTDEAKKALEALFKK
jgi:hypothetical protein